MYEANVTWFGRLSRRQVLGGIAVGTASLAVGGTGRGRLVVAQEARHLPHAGRDGFTWRGWHQQRAVRRR